MNCEEVVTHQGCHPPSPSVSWALKRHKRNPEEDERRQIMDGWMDGWTAILVQPLMKTQALFFSMFIT